MRLFLKIRNVLNWMHWICEMKKLYSGNLLNFHQKRRKEPTWCITRREKREQIVGKEKVPELDFSVEKQAAVTAVTVVFPTLIIDSMILCLGTAGQSQHGSMMSIPWQSTASPWFIPLQFPCVFSLLFNLTVPHCLTVPMGEQSTHRLPSSWWKQYEDRYLMQHIR